MNRINLANGRVAYFGKSAEAKLITCWKPILFSSTAIGSVKTFPTDARFKDMFAKSVCIVRYKDVRMAA